MWAPGFEAFSAHSAGLAGVGSYEREAARARPESAAALNLDSAMSQLPNLPHPDPTAPML